MAEQIVMWPKNGIEYYYPTGILAALFSTSLEQVSQLTIDADRVSINGITKTKNELATEVIRQLSEATTYPAELEGSLLVPLSKAVE